MKLHGSYEALEGGVVHDTLVDLIGGVGEKIDIFHEFSQLDFINGVSLVPIAKIQTIRVFV